MRTLRATEVTDDQRLAVIRLADAIRELTAAAVVAELDAQVLVETAAKLDELRARLPAPARSGALREPLDGPRRAREHQLPLRTGSYHPFAVPLEVHFSADGRHCWAELTADGTHEGPPAAVHGGIVAWLMDVMLGILVQAGGAGALTKNLRLDYQRPTPLGRPLRLEARIVAVDGRRTTVHGTVSHAGEITATAQGTFVVPRSPVS